MAMAANLVAVGSQSHVSLLDPRMAQPTIRALDSIDPGQVRKAWLGRKSSLGLVSGPVSLVVCTPSQSRSACRHKL